MIPRAAIGVWILVGAPVAGAQTGLFGELRSMVPPSDQGAAAALFADVDSDGDPDLLVAVSFSGNDLSSVLLENDGTGIFTRAEEFPVDSTPNSDVAFADLDGDGRGDVYFTSLQTRDLLYLGDGGGGFQDASDALPEESNHEVSVSLGDVDGDGHVDVLTGSSAQGTGWTNLLLLNQGAPPGSVAFTPSASGLPGVPDNTTSVELVDVDLDGDLDLLTANRAFAGTASGPESRLDRNDGLGGFTTVPLALPAIAAFVDGFEVADVDLDGDPDLITETELSALLLNDGTGLFAGGLVGSPPWAEPVIVAVGDTDGDGLADAVLGGEQDELDHVSGLLVGSGAEATLFAHGTADLADLLLQDVDSDGDLDLVAVFRFARTQLYLNDGAGGFTSGVQTVPAPPGGLVVVSAGDLTGDGQPDLFVGAHGQDRLLVNRGGGDFVDATPSGLPLVENRTDLVELFDFDGDGDLDAFTAGSEDLVFGSDQDDRLYLNDGLGGFSELVGSVPEADGSTLAAVGGDFDGDGQPDLATSRASGSSQIELWFGAGGASLNGGELSLFPSPFGFLGTVTDLAAGDLDTDGDLDLVSARGVQDLYFLNDGSGGFATVEGGLVGPPAFATQGSTVVLGDVDADSDLDVFFGNSIIGTSGLFTNDGSAVFTFSDGFPSSEFSSSARTVALVDVDEDADLDLLLGPDDLFGNSSPLQLFLNDGGGGFSPASELLPVLAPSASGLDAADLDGDGDVDFAFVARGEARILSGLRRQLFRRGPARIGKPLGLELRGDPGSSWILSLAQDTSTTPIPPFGTLGLDPLSLVFVDAGRLDASGRGEFRLPVPGDPELVGVLVPLQALVGAPLRLTNLELVELTAL